MAINNNSNVTIITNNNSRRTTITATTNNRLRISKMAIITVKKAAKTRAAETDLEVREEEALAANIITVDEIIHDQDIQTISNSNSSSRDEAVHQAEMVVQGDRAETTGSQLRETVAEAREVRGIPLVVVVVDIQEAAEAVEAIVEEIMVVVVNFPRADHHELALVQMEKEAKPAVGRRQIQLEQTSIRRVLKTIVLLLPAK
jgi:hypothetical protein